MYISHKYKIVFLRTSRCAGTSIQEFLIRNLDDPEALYTPLHWGSEQIKSSIPESVINSFRPYNFNYLTLEDLARQAVLSPVKFHEYYMFQVLRDPLDRQRSTYSSIKNSWSPDTEPSANEYDELSAGGINFKGAPGATLKQSNVFKYEDKNYGNIWLYEDLNAHLEEFTDKYNISVTHPLEKRKSSNRDTHFNLNHTAVSHIANCFEEDFAMYTKIRKTAYESHKSNHS